MNFEPGNETREITSSDFSVEKNWIGEQNEWFFVHLAVVEEVGKWGVWLSEQRFLVTCGFSKLFLQLEEALWLHVFFTKRASKET